jgi:hypothetical protein
MLPKRKRGRPRKEIPPPPPKPPYVNKIQEGILKEFKKKSLNVGDMVSIMGYKTMGMLISDPTKTQNMYNRDDYRYTVTVQLFKQRGQDCSRVMDFGLEAIRKFHPWPYFYKKTPKQMKESALNGSESVV